MMKKLILLIAIFLLSLNINIAYAEDQALIYAVNSHLVSYNGADMDILPDPKLYKGVSYVPARFTVECLGGTVGYNPVNDSMEIEYEGKRYEKSLAGAKYFYEGVSYLPVREICDMFGWSLTWCDGLIFITTESDSSQLAQMDGYYKNRLGFYSAYDFYEVYEKPMPEKLINFSVEAGCYSEPFLLELSTNVRNAKIYYTTDGSMPTTNSMVYAEPIRIYDRTPEANALSNNESGVVDNFMRPKGQMAKGTVIKAMAVSDLNAHDYTHVAVNTYFVGIDLKSRYGVKVISITADESDLFNPIDGIYSYNNSIQLSNKKEAPAYLEIFDTNNSRVVAQPIGVRLNGAGTRILQQKSLRVYARTNDYYVNGDKKTIKYDLFDGAAVDVNGEPITKYKRFILRNGGDDWSQFFMKDAMVQAMCKPFSLEMQASSNAIVFINGEYFGFHRMRERYDNQYFKYHYDLNDEDDAVLIQIAANPMYAELSEGTEEDLQDFNDKIYYIINNDMTIENCYNTVSEYFDMGSFIDYYIVNVFFENVDWPHNNIKIWRNKNPENGDMRYKFMASDEDTSLVDLGKLYSVEYGKNSDMAKKWKGSNSNGTLGYKIDDEKEDCLLNFAFRSLLKNSVFKTEFIRRYNDYLNTVLTTWNVTRHAEKFFYEPIELRDEHIARFPGSWTKTDISDIEAWAKERPARAKKELENYFDIYDEVKVTFKCNLEHGYISANNIELRNGTEFELNSPENYTSSYFKDFPLWFAANPLPGYQLDYFLVNGEVWNDATNYVIHPTKKTTIEAIFKQEVFSAPEFVVEEAPVVETITEPITKDAIFEAVLSGSGDIYAPMTPEETVLQ